MSTKPGEASPGAAGNWPRWALTTGDASPAVDPTTGKAASIEPASAIKNAGWSPFRVKLSRNIANWLQEYNYRWIRYLDQTAHRAATRVVAASNADAESLRMADYVCDGTADEVQINAAIDAANAAGGGIVQLSEGTFTVTVTTGEVLLKSGVTLRGRGIGATTIKVPTGGTDSGNAQRIVRNANASGDVGIGVEDLTIDGNRVNSTKSNVGLFLLEVARARLRNVRVTGGNKSTNFGSYQPAGFYLDGCTFATVDHCIADDCDRFGWYILDTTTDMDLVVSDCWATDCSAESAGAADAVTFSGGGRLTLRRVIATGTNVGDGFDGGMALAVLDNCQAIGTRRGFNVTAGRLVGCRAVSCTVNSGFTTSGGAATFMRCVATSNTQEGFVVDGGALVECEATLNGRDGFYVAGRSFLRGCAAQSNAQDGGATTYVGYRFTSAADRSLMLGCTSITSVLTNKEKYAVHLETGSADIVVAQCYLQKGVTTGNAGDAVQDDGTGNGTLPTDSSISTGNKQYT